MPGKLYQGQGEVVTPHLGATQIHAMYLGSTYVGYDSRYSTFISASGGTIYDSGSYRYHLFTSSADFTVHSVPLSQLNSRVEILTVGGGGGGQTINVQDTIQGTCFWGSGGGLPGNGGAVVHIPDSANYSLNIGTYTVTVGAGGTGSRRTANVCATYTGATGGGNSIITGSNVQIIALGGSSETSTFVSQSSLSGLSGQYGHNFPSGVARSKGGPGGGGAGEPGTDGSDVLCGVPGIPGDGYQVDTFPFSYTRDDGSSTLLFSSDYWGGGGGGAGSPQFGGGCVGQQGFTGQAQGGGGNAGQAVTGTGVPNTGGGGAAYTQGAGNGGSGFVGFRYRIA